MAGAGHLDTKEAADSLGLSATTRSEGREAPDLVDRSEESPSRVFEFHDLQVEQRPIDSLTPRRGNPRTHSAKQIRQIANSIRTFGFAKV